MAFIPFLLYQYVTEMFFIPTSSADSINPVTVAQKLKSRDETFCSVLAISYLGAKHDFEICAFEVFFLWTRKTPLRMASRGSDLNIKIGLNTQEIPHNA